MIMPTAGQLGSMRCPRIGCGHTIWTDIKKCPYCYFDVRAYQRKKSYQRDLQILQRKSNIVEWVCLVCALLMLITISLKYSIWLLFGLFIIFALGMSIINMLDEKIMQLRNQLKEFDILTHKENP